MIVFVLGHSCETAPALHRTSPLGTRAAVEVLASEDNPVATGFDYTDLRASSYDRQNRQRFGTIGSTSAAT